MTDTGIFYGTGAAEGVPSPFCDCPMCNYAREHGRKGCPQAFLLSTGQEYYD